MPKMSASEAFVETLVAYGVTDVFGIVGSAYMDALDLFPAAGIRFIPTAHEQGAGHMADGYSRALGRATASASRRTARASPISSPPAPPPIGRIRRWWSSRRKPAPARMGLGGFQETEQLPIFSKITKYQAHVVQASAHGGTAGALLRHGDDASAGRRSSTFRATISMARPTTPSPARARSRAAPAATRASTKRRTCWPRRSSR